MIYKFTVFLLIIHAVFCSLADDVNLTILDTGKSIYLQEFFSRVFDKENIALPQDVVINITATPWSEIKDIPSDCVVADDGLALPALPEKWTKNIYAYQPVVLAVNLNNPLDEVNIESLQRIYSGRAGNWSRVGSKAGKIITAGYPEDSAVSRVFRRKVMQQDLADEQNSDINRAIVPDMIICRTPQAAAALVQSSEKVIVFGGAGLLENSAKKYKILKVNGVFPSVENIISGKYKLVAAHSIISSKNNPPVKLPELLNFLQQASAIYSQDMLPAK